MSDISSSKLCQLLEVFSSREMSKFVDFVSSPYHNKNKVAISISKELAKVHPNYAKLKREKVEKKCGSKNLNSDMSLLLKLAESFFAIQHLENNSYLNNYIKVNEFNKRGVGKPIQKVLKDFKSEIQQVERKSFDELLYSFLIDEETDLAYDHDITMPYEWALQSKSQSLDAFYVYNKLKIYSDMNVRERLLNVQYKKTFFKEIREFVGSRPEEFSKYPSVQMYLKLIEMLEDDISRDQYEGFFQSLQESIETMPQDEARNFVQHGINHCIKMMNTGHDYLTELFDAMRFQVENNLLMVNNFVHDRSYKNIIEVAIRKEEFEWAEQFLDSHVEYITTDDRSMIYNYNQANIFFAKGDYKAALRNLTFVNFKNVFYQISYRSLLIKIYLETNDTLSVESSVKNFKSFLKRETSLSDIQSNSYNNFLKIVSSISRLLDKKNHLSEEELQLKKKELLSETDEEKQLADKRWLVKQIGELK